MTNKKAITDAKPTIIVANDPDDRKGRLKTIGGSESEPTPTVSGAQQIPARAAKQVTSRASAIVCRNERRHRFMSKLEHIP
jgi:hypothetical protein